MGATILGSRTADQVPLLLTDEAAFEGLYLLGLTGTGKSNLLAQMALARIYAGHGLALLDAHGTTVQEVLWRIPKERRGDVVLLDPLDEDWPFGITLWECPNPSSARWVTQATSQAVAVIKRFYGDPQTREYSWGPHLESLLTNTVRVMIDNPECTLADVPVFLTDANCRKRLLAKVRDPLVSDYWREYGRQGGHRQDFVESTYNKIDMFLRLPLHAAIFGQPSTFSMDEIVRQGKILLAPMPEEAGDDLVALLGGSLVALLLRALQRRPVNRRVPFGLLCDEFHRFAAGSDFATLIDEGRKLSAATVVAHQRVHQLDPFPQARHAVWGTKNKLFFQLEGEDDADLAVRQLAITPEPGVISLQPLRQIARGHSDPQVQTFVLRYLSRIDYQLDQGRPHVPSPGRFVDPTEIRQAEEELARYQALRGAIDEMNRYLVRRMQGQDESWRLLEIIQAVAPYLGGQQTIEALTPTQYSRLLPLWIKQPENPRVQWALEAVAARNQNWPAPRHPALLHVLAGFIEHLVAAGDVLEQQPVWAERDEPVSQARERLRAELVTQPNFTAVYKILDAGIVHQGQFTTRKLADFTYVAWPEVAARKGWIVQNTRNQYARDRTVVIESMLKRRRNLREGVPQPEKKGRPPTKLST